MARGEKLSVQLGFCTGGIHGISAPIGRVLNVRAPDIARFAQGLVAVIDASQEASAQAYDILDRSFRQQSAAASVPAGQEEQYVAGVLESLSALGLGRNRQSVIVAVWLGRDVLLGSLGLSRAYLCREDGIKDITNALPAVEGSEVRVMRLPLQVNDALVLAGGGLYTGIDLRDVQQTVLYSPASLSLHDQAAWLVNVASARSGLAASAAIMRFTTDPSLRDTLLRAGQAGRWKVTGILTAIVVIAAALASVGLVLTSVLAQSTPRKKVIPTTTPVVLAAYPRPQLTRPFGTLASSQARDVEFCWRDRVPAQAVRLEIQSGTSRTQPSLPSSTFRVLPGGLQCTSVALHSGHSYQWRLSMSAPGYVAQWTTWQTFRIAAPPKPHQRTKRNPVHPSRTVRHGTVSKLAKKR